jgi:hypothetical protein
MMTGAGKVRGKKHRVSDGQINKHSQSRYKWLTTPFIVSSIFDPLQARLVNCGTCDS